MKRKLVALGLLAVMCISLCSCTKDTANKADIDLSGYPIDTDVTLSYWVSLDPNISSSYANMGETEFSKELCKRTGVKIEYLHPAAGQDAESFNLLAASGDLPDLVEHAWIPLVSGGPQGALDNGLILPLNDLMKEYSPNFMAYMEEHPEYDRRIKTDAGVYYAYPFIRGDKKLLVSSGPVVREDWLNELRLDKPTTIDEWEEMLIAFRDKKGASAPLTVTASETKAMLALFGASKDFYVSGDEVKFGVLEDGFKEALQKLNHWYKEGLLDRNYALVDGKIKDTNILNGLSGVTIGSGGSGIGKWLNAKEGDGGFNLCALPFPKIDGAHNRFSLVSDYYYTYSATAITTNCKYPELAAKYMDYLYGEEGHMLANFGIEGVSYEMIEGYPTYTDTVMKDPDGQSVSQAMARYIRGNMAGPFVQDARYIEQYYEKPQQKDALDVWGAASDTALKHLLPSLTYTSDESSEYSNLYSDISKYCNESIARFISGDKSLEEFDGFIAELKKMQIDRAIEIQQAAYDRYLKR